MADIDIEAPSEAPEAPSEAPTVRPVPHRNYTRLPNDAGLLKLWYENDENLAKTATAIGCSPAAVGSRIRKLGIEPPHRTRRGPVAQVREHAKTLEVRLDELETNLESAFDAYKAKYVDLERRVFSLETVLRRAAIAQNQPKVNNKRIADGGKHAKDQRNERKTA